MNPNLPTSTLKSRLRTGTSQIIRSQSGKAQALRFMMVGGFATVLQLGVYTLLVELTPLSAEIATVASYIISFLFNFVMTSRFTFKSKSSAKKGLGFIASHAVNLGLQTLLVIVFKGLVGAQFALMPALIICVPVNFMLVRFVFTKI